MKSRILASVSGGETSMYMAKWLKENMADNNEIIYVFANTSQELEETLEFVEQCDQAFGLNVVWVEALVNPQRGPGCGTKATVTNFENAKRNGEVFEAMIAKYGIPFIRSPHCTRELKNHTIRAYARSIGWKSNTYDLAIGIRADEIDRINPKRREQRFIYPFVEYVEKTKKDVNTFWRDQPFRLKIKSYEGNCKTCFKKSDRKLATIALEHPEWYDFYRDMEVKYEFKPDYQGKIPERPNRFFRSYRSCDDIFKLLENKDFQPSTDDKIVYDYKWDISNGCSESCEVF